MQLEIVKSKQIFVQLKIFKQDFAQNPEQLLINSYADLDNFPKSSQYFPEMLRILFQAISHNIKVKRCLLHSERICTSV